MALKIRVLGGGFYGCHIATHLLELGHNVDLHESSNRLFAGASGANPARLHIGPHYPRSKLTRAMCQVHNAEFMAVYGHLTRAVRTNIYAVADKDSLVDFGTYRQVLTGEVEFITIREPGEFGLRNVEGAILTGERHIVIEEAREFFTERLALDTHYRTPAKPDSKLGFADLYEYDWTIDATFCALGSDVVDRYEPCITGFLGRSPVDMAVTIMDGPFPSVYPWQEASGLSSLTSASLTPLSKSCKTWEEAWEFLNGINPQSARTRMVEMVEQMAHFWPEVRQYRIADYRLAVRAMPRSGADARLVDVTQVGDRLIRIRAGKIDAIFAAARQVQEIVER